MHPTKPVGLDNRFKMRTSILEIDDSFVTENRKELNARKTRPWSNKNLYRFLPALHLDIGTCQIGVNPFAIRVDNMSTLSCDDAKLVGRILIDF